MTKKDNIINVALELFLKNGYENTSLESILNEAEVSKGGMYHHFKSKETLLDEVINFYIERDIKKLENDLTRTSVNACEKLIAIFTAPFEDEDITKKSLVSSIKTGSIFYYRVVELSRIKTISVLNEVLKEGVEEKVFKHEDSFLVSTLIYDMILDLRNKVNFVSGLKKKKTVEYYVEILAKLLCIEKKVLNDINRRIL